MTGSPPQQVSAPSDMVGEMRVPRSRCRWVPATCSEQHVQRLATALGVSPITARVLLARGLGEPEAARRFMESSLERDWLDPSMIAGMDAAAERVAVAIERHERVLVFGDFDLDGVSAAALLHRGLADLGADVRSFVPHRITDGYGLTEPAVERALRYKPDLVVTVDCGISGANEVELLRARGVDVVVTDHHEPGDLVPRGVPVADPKLEGGSPSRDLAGAGVALKLVQAVGARMGEPELWRGLVDLAMLGTVADVVPLTGENRALVSAGIARLRREPRLALAALCSAAGVPCGTLTADAVAYALAPRLNAAGRMASADAALELLLTEDPARAEALAVELDRLNRLRQDVENDLLLAVDAMIERTYRGERAIVLAGEGWHEGVKGIVASRVAASRAVPVVLFSVKDGIARGSGRSSGSVDLFTAVASCEEVLERFGGHSAAVGLTLAAERIGRFRELLLAHLDTLPAEAFTATLPIDAEVALGDLSVELGAELSSLEPFGYGNPRPLLAVRNVFMNGRERVGRGSAHLRFEAFDGAASVPAIAFRCRDIDELAVRTMPVDIAFELGIDEWRGRRRAQLIARDIRPSSDEHDARSADVGAGELVERLFEAADELIAREEYAGIEDAPFFHTKLAGVTFDGRQELIARLEPGVPLRVVREPDNPHDPCAVALVEPYGTRVGYLNRRLAAVLAPAIDAGGDYDAEIAELTGGTEGRAYGVNVVVRRRDLADALEEADGPVTERRNELMGLTVQRLDERIIETLIGDRPLHRAQHDALAALARGERTLAVMATGRGKSLIFHAHAARLALREGRASVFVYPLRALVADQAFHLTETLGALGVPVRVLTGESSPAERDEVFAALESGRVDVVLTTPEFLHYQAPRFQGTRRVGFVVIDEAHHVGTARAGHRPIYGKLGETIARLGEPHVLAVTATAPDEVVDALRSSLGIERFVFDPACRDNLLVEDARGCTDKDARLVELARRGTKLVIYVNSREASVRIARMLRKQVPELGMRIAFYNGGLSRALRHAIEAAFRTGEVRVVVATSAFGEGVDIADIRDVVLYHLPFSAVEFNQMAGRAGRDGALARIHLLFGGKDAAINERILSALAPSREDLAVLYRVLRELARRDGEGLEVTNGELAAACARARRGCSLDERGVSNALGIFRELGLVAGGGHGPYRRLTLVEDAPRVELTESVRYAEGLDEIAEFRAFRDWVLRAPASELLARINRPILPTRT